MKLASQPGGLYENYVVKLIHKFTLDSGVPYISMIPPMHISLLQL